MQTRLFHGPFEVADRLLEFVDDATVVVGAEGIDHRPIIPERPLASTAEVLPEVAPHAAVVGQQRPDVMELIGGGDQADRRRRRMQTGDILLFPYTPRRFGTVVTIGAACHHTGNRRAEPLDYNRRCRRLHAPVTPPRRPPAGAIRTLTARLKSRPIEFTAEPADNERLANLCGPVERNIRTIAEYFDTRVSRRGQRFRIEGDPAAAEQARDMLARFWQAAARPLSLEDIQLGLAEQRPASAEGEEGEDEGPILHTRRSDLRGRTPRQRDYLRNILSHDITFGIGPAGTGKTYLAVACAVDALERDAIKRIVLTRPAVEAGERLGFLPGDLAQKVDPYLRPLYDALNEMMGVDAYQRLVERGAVEVAPLAYMRGRTLNDAFIILDEAQNTTPEQMKMFLTRLGFGSKMVVTGDITQIDLPRGRHSGLVVVRHILSQIEGIGFVTFDSHDVVRHKLVQDIVTAYKTYAEQEARGVKGTRRRQAPRRSLDV
mgnify:CR=1 FL=1